MIGNIASTEDKFNSLRTMLNIFNENRYLDGYTSQSKGNISVGQAQDFVVPLEG